MKLTNWLGSLTLPFSHSTARPAKRRPTVSWLGRHLETLESRVVLTANLMASQAEELLMESRGPVAAEVAAAVADPLPYVVSITPSFTTPLPASTSTFNFTMTFSEPVRGVTMKAISIISFGVNKGFVPSITKVSDSVYTLSLSNVVPAKGSADSATVRIRVDRLEGISDMAGQELESFYQLDKAYLYRAPNIQSPTDITLSKSSVAENSKVGTVVGKLDATSANKKETFTYRLVPGGGATDNNSFAISGSNLTTTKVFDFEAQKTYSIRLEVRDSNGNSFVKAFTIKVTDATERVTFAPDQTFEVTEQSPNGTVVGKVLAGGGRVGQTLKYEIKSSTLGIFAIDSTTGVITIVDGSKLSQADSFQFPLAIQATTVGKGKPQSIIHTFQIDVKPLATEMAVQSISLTSADPITTDTATFAVKFTRSVRNVASTNFSLVTTGGAIGGSIASVTTTDKINFVVTVSGINPSAVGTLALKLTDPTKKLTAGEGVKLPTDYSFTSSAYTVGTPTAYKPTVTSLNRGTNDPITSELTQFTVTFSEAVTGVTASNFVVVTTGGVIANANVSVIRYSDTQYIATATGIDFETAGTLGVNLVDPTGSIKSATNQTVDTTLPYVGQTYAVENGSPATTPIILSILKTDHLPISGTTAEFQVTFNEAVSGVVASNFVANASGGVSTDATVEVTQVGGGSVYIVKVTGISKTGSGGTLKLDFFDFGSIKDANNDGLPADYSYGGLEYSVV